MADDTDPIRTTLKDRSKYGPMELQWEMSQRLKGMVGGYDNRNLFNTLDPLSREALDMICLKISRIVCGDYSDLDHWHDIAGYATLRERELKGEEK